MTFKQSDGRDVKPRPQMVKIKEVKEDGRVLIYYSFVVSTHVVSTHVVSTDVASTDVVPTDNDERKKASASDDAACVGSKEST